MRIALLLACLASSQAFMVAPSLKTPTRLHLLTPAETEKLLLEATECAEGECSVDQVGDLIETLKGQQKELYDRVDQVRSMIASLEVVNAKPERQVDEVRETVRAIWRVFQLGDKASGNDYPKLSRPTGWSGEVGKGPQTAYDVLSPKKWKAPSP